MSQQGDAAHEHDQQHVRTALLIVDVQHGFLNDRTTRLPDLIHEFRARAGKRIDVVVTTQFVQPPEGGNFRRLLNWRKMIVSPDIDIASPVNAVCDHVTTKRTYNAFVNTDLHSYLTEQRVRTVLVCGLNVDGCVLATTVGLFDHGYTPVVLTDLCDTSARDPEMLTHGLMLIAASVGRNQMTTSDEFLNDGDT